MKLEKILKSKGLYYVALVLMVVNVLGYVSVGSLECIVVFAVTYYLSNSYTKNQSVDILCGLFVANVVFGCGRVREGFEGTTTKLEKAAADAATKMKAAACKKGSKDPKCIKQLAEAAKLAQAAAGKSKSADSEKKKQTA